MRRDCVKYTIYRQPVLQSQADSKPCIKLHCAVPTNMCQELLSVELGVLRHRSSQFYQLSSSDQLPRRPLRYRARELHSPYTDRDGTTKRKVPVSHIARCMETSGFWSCERYFQHDIFVDLERDLFGHKASSFKLRSRTLCKSLLDTILSSAASASKIQPRRSSDLLFRLSHVISLC
jgi:hypothetical protein